MKPSIQNAKHTQTKKRSRHNADAYIRVNADPTSTHEASKKLEAINGAVVHEVLGLYDSVVDLEADTQEDITEILRHQIRPIKDVTSAVTCICF